MAGINTRHSAIKSAAMAIACGSYARTATKPHVIAFGLMPPDQVVIALLANKLLSNKLR